MDREVDVVRVWCVVGSCLGSVKPERCWNHFPINRLVGKAVAGMLAGIYPGWL